MLIAPFSAYAVFLILLSKKSVPKLKIPFFYVTKLKKLQIKKNNLNLNLL